MNKFKLNHHHHKQTKEDENERNKSTAANWSIDILFNTHKNHPFGNDQLNAIAK